MHHLFAESNLFKAICLRVKDGSLYLPPVGFEVERHYSPSLTYSHGLRRGYEGRFHAVELLLTIVGYDANEDEHIERRVTTDVLIPVELADAYTVKTEAYGLPANNLTREVMTFAYSKRAFAAWVKTERERLRAGRRETLGKQIAALTAELKALSR